MPATTSGVESIRARVDNAVRFALLETNMGRTAVENSLQPARAIVLDANQVRGELKRLARSKDDTALLTLAKIGLLRLFAAGHVVEEVTGYLDKWADQTTTPRLAYRAAWEERLLPQVTQVDFAQELLTPDEQSRIDILGAPGGDSDDVPSVVVAMVLRAPLLSGDTHPMRAAYGLAVDPEQHAAYVRALFAAGRALVLAHSGRSAFTAAWIASSLGVDGARALAGRFGPTRVVAGGAVAVAFLLASQQARGRLYGAGQALGRAGTVLLELQVIHQQAEMAAQSLESPLLSDLDALPPRVLAEREKVRSAAMSRAASRSAACIDATPLPMRGARD